MKSKRTFSAIMTTLLLLSILMISTLAAFAAKPAPPPGPTLNPKTIPKYTQQLVIPPAYTPTNVLGVDTYSISMVSGVSQQILPAPLPATTTWAYSGVVTGGGVLAHSPAATFEAVKGTPVQVTWTNAITSDYMFLVDPTLHWADPTNPTPGTMRMWDTFPPTAPGIFTNTETDDTLNAQTTIPLVTHLHGGEVISDYDGGPEQWFTNNVAIAQHGPDYRSATIGQTNAATYYYPNEQEAATLWYHDHALGLTRINVMSGLAGFYLLRDPTSTFDQYMTTNFEYGVNEIPIAIQDRSFNLDGSFWFDTVGVNPAVHPYWMPEFFGNTIMVNGKVWPNLNVDRGLYRFRVLDGSNARFYTISLKDQTTGAKLPFTQIGTDGGYLKAPVTLKELTIAPGERADIIVDFSGIAAGTKIIVENKAKAPFPNGAQPDPQTTGQIMQFTVSANAGSFTGPVVYPVTGMNPTLPVSGAWPTLPAPQAFEAPAVNPRTLPLVEVMGALGPLEVLLNGEKWMSSTTEEPRVGDTEDWVIPNLTADTHPIHLHLVQFQLVSRQKFDAAKYTTDWFALNADGSEMGNGMPPWLDDWTVKPLDVTPYLYGKVMPTPANEQGWKDTVKMNPGEVTVIRVRFAPQDAPTTGEGAPTAGDPGTNPYPFDPSLDTSPGYVWHCHIIDHEDNEMMRRYKVIP